MKTTGKQFLGNRKFIPPTAKRIFQGKLFSIYQWEQEMFDGSLQTFEMAKRPDTVEVIPVLDGENVMVLEERQPNSDASKVTFPGGDVKTMNCLSRQRAES